MRILGLSAYTSDSAAALVEDGAPVACVEEERFTRRKGEPAFPSRAVRSCLRQAGLSVRDLDRVAFFEKPLRKFERALATQLAAFPRSGRSFSREVFHWLGDRLWTKDRIATELGLAPGRIVFVEHHLAHAASAFLPSPFEDAAILVVDGAGEWTTTSLARGRGRTIEVLAELELPHSLGLFASAFAQFLGFAPEGGEARAMDLAAHGTPRFVDELREWLSIESDGSFRVDPRPFRFVFDRDRLFDGVLERRFGPARIPGAPLRMHADDSRDADLAASVQALIEEALLALARALHARTGSANLCLAGTVAFNARAIDRLAREGPFEHLFVQPACGDAGAALGAALFAHHELTGAARVWMQKHAFLGEPIDTEESSASPEVARANSTDLAQRLARGKTVGVARGRFEWGPRGLGHRSLFADPRGIEGARALRSIKHREEFRSFALAVRAERAHEFLDLPTACNGVVTAPSSFLLSSSPVLGTAREPVAGAVQADGRVRVHCVSAETDPELADLLAAFDAETGVPALLETSLNLRGDPIARTAKDALFVLERTGLDALAIEDRLYARR
jgi:carbamoyltransferase